MKCYEVIEKLETLSPLNFAEEWDNIGLLAGRRDKDIKIIYIALDATDDASKEDPPLSGLLPRLHHP